MTLAFHQDDSSMIPGDGAGLPTRDRDDASRHLGMWSTFEPARQANSHGVSINQSID